MFNVSRNLVRQVLAQILHASDAPAIDEALHLDAFGWTASSSSCMLVDSAHSLIASESGVCDAWLPTGGGTVRAQAAAYMGPEQEAAFQVLCRWSAALGYILMAHLDGFTSVDIAAKVQAAHTCVHSLAHPSCMPLVR